MKLKIRTFLVIVATATITNIAYSQTPYDDFAPSETKKEILKLPDVVYTAFNEDSTSIVKFIELDKELLTLKYFGQDNSLISQVQLDISDFKWLSVDPLAKDFPNWSPYAAFANNPIYYIDPDGRKFINFDSEGNYAGTTKDNWFHNTFVGSKGRVLDANGTVTNKFRFADPTNDVAQIQKGVITRLVLVNESDIKLMVSRSGGFNSENKTANRSWGDRYGYIMKEGKGGGRMDFSYTQIPRVYPDASSDPLNSQSPLIFLVGNVAHNQMNFGNFMFGTSGQSMGFTQLELRAGAHYNSLTAPETNGYERQWDSSDDQFSIKQGFQFGNQQNYDKMEYKIEVGPISSGTVAP